MAPFSRLKTIAVGFLIVTFLFPQAGVAAGSREAMSVPGRSVAIIPIMDGDADVASKAVSELLADALRATTPFHVASTQSVQRVLAYQDQGSREAKGTPEQQDLARAKELYLAFQLREARKLIDETIVRLRPMTQPQEQGPLLIEAELVRAQIAKAQGDTAALQNSLRGALAVDPTLTLSAERYPPSLVAACETARNEVLSGPKAELVVESVPPAAEVMLNGIARGVTPLTLTDLPAGNYSLTVRANRYQEETRTVQLPAGGRELQKVKLAWRSKRKAVDEIVPTTDAVSDGARFAQALHVDRVIVLNAQTLGNQTRLTARVVDPSLRVALSPVEVLSFTRDRSQVELARMTATLARQLTIDSVEALARELTPSDLAIADPALLQARKKPITKRPAFWIAVGGVAVGALVGGLLASMGGSASQGSLRVQFK